MSAMLRYINAPTTAKAANFSRLSLRLLIKNLARGASGKY